jgi:type I restriction enzyme S subunit
MARYPIAIPPEPIRAQLTRVVRNVDDYFRTHADEKRTLGALRDALLPRLLSGQLRVQQAEQLVEEAV